MPLRCKKLAVVERTLIAPSIMESRSALYTAEQLITRRDEVKAKIQEQINSFLNETLMEKDLAGLLTIANVAITDFDFSAEFNRAEEKVERRRSRRKTKSRSGRGSR